MAQYAHQQVTITGAVITPVTPTTSDTVAPNDRVILEYENTNASPRTVTIVTPTSLNQFGADLPNLTYTLPATPGRLRVGPLSQGLADPTTQLITVNIDATAGVTVAAVRV